MNVDEFSMLQKDAAPLWKEYVEALKKNPDDKFLQGMKKVYHL